MFCWFCYMDLVFSNVLLTLYHRIWLHLPKYIPGNLKCSTSQWVTVIPEVESIKRWGWGRKGTGWADSIWKEKETPSCAFSELWTMCLVAVEKTYLWPNWPAGLINAKSIPRFPFARKNVIIPYVVNQLCNLYGTHWCRLQWITSWPFWLWIMAITWLYLPLTFSRLSLRNLWMWAWACTLKVYTVFTKVSQGP